MDAALVQIVDLLNKATTSNTGTAVAALVLSVLVFLLQRVPAISAALAKNAWVKRGAVMFLAVVPAVITSLTTKSSWYDAVVTAAITFLATLGVDSMVPKAPESTA